MSSVAHVSQSQAIRVETVEERKQTPPACVYHGFDLVPVLLEAGSNTFEMIHDLRTLVERCCDRAQLLHELQTLGVLREETKTTCQDGGRRNHSFSCQELEVLVHRDRLSYPHQEGDQVSPFLGRYQP